MQTLEQFRKPDASFGYQWAVWYGPDGVNSDCATEVEKGAGYYVVRGYQDVTGYYDVIPPEGHILCIETTVEASSLRHAARLGVDKIAEQGGEESFVTELPQ